MPVVLIDGDIARKTVSRDLGYTKEERDRHISRVADICYLINQSNVNAIACVISPTKEIREYARNNIENFIEVYIKCPLDICKDRDVKGHYKRVAEGEIKEFVGITIPYEEPQSPEITIETDKKNVDEGVEEILRYVEAEGFGQQ